MSSSHKAIIDITPAAVTYICDIMAQNNALGLRVGLKKGGCAGMEYTIEIAKNHEIGEECVEKDGCRIFIPPSALLFLLGMTVDYQTNLLESGLKFINPNIKESCGCGESINFK